jgi:putative aminopeptidase FrvX
MKAERIALLEKVTQIDGVPGFEDDVREFMRGRL